MQRRDKIVLQKIVSEIQIGIKLLGSTDMTEFLNDEMMKRAVGMTTINVGELVKNLTLELRNKYPDIPWKAIAGMRDIAAHRYQTLRMEDVYNTVHDEFPDLEKRLQHILLKESKENGE